MARKTDDDASISNVCTTCGKNGDHLSIDCPYNDLLAQASMEYGPPPAPSRLSPPICPVCRCDPNPGRRRRDDDSLLRVTNLPAGTSDRDLRRLFAPFGIIISASSSADEPERSGFVEFDQVQDEQEAMEWLNGDVYADLGLRVEWAAPLDPRPPPICAGCLRCAETWIRVTNLSEGTGERDLRNLACPFGIIRRLGLADDDDDERVGLRRKVGVVEFDQREDAEDAVTWLDGHVFDDLVLRVQGPLKL